MALDAYSQNGRSQITLDPMDQAEQLFDNDFLGTIPQDDSIFDFMDFSAAGDPFFPSFTTQKIQHFGQSHQTAPQGPPPRPPTPALPRSIHGLDFSTGSTEQSTTPATRSKRYTPAQREILDAWISAHQADPYLDANHREQLALSTGLSRQQVSTYFTNYRRRKLLRNQADHIVIDSAPATQDTERSQHGLDTTLETIQSDSQCSSNYGRDHSAVSREVRPHFDVDERSEVGDSFRWSFQSLPVVPVKSKLSDFDCNLLEWYLNGYNAEACGCLGGLDEQCMFCGKLPRDFPPLCPQETDVMKDCTSSTAGICAIDTVPRAQLRMSTYQNSTGPSTLDRFLMDTGEEIVADGTGSELSSASLVLSHVSPVVRSSKHHSLSVSSLRRHRDSRSEASSKGSSRQSASSYVSLGSRKGRRAYGWVSKKKSVKPASRAASASGVRPRSPAGVCVKGPTDISCELCTQFFATPYSKRRHLATIHRQSEQHWICGPLFVKGDLVCPICLSAPSNCPHRTLSCWKRSQSDRTYYRRDSFTQHLINMHDLTTPAANLLARHQHCEHPRRYAGIRAEVEAVGCVLLQLKAGVWETFSNPSPDGPMLSLSRFEDDWRWAMGLYFGRAYWVEAFNSQSPHVDYPKLDQAPWLVQAMYRSTVSELGKREAGFPGSL